MSVLQNDYRNSLLMDNSTTDIIKYGISTGIHIAEMTRYHNAYIRERDALAYDNRTANTNVLDYYRGEIIKNALGAVVGIAGLFVIGIVGLIESRK